ncbi:RNA-binding S4 domain-containing protein [Kocuria koreensis]|jgi:ribosome-associated protein|uniref:RNA-binding S4 domain-containing protein n=1 Tax=Rothia koreensis TaxID=592378 RepID=A0A7K1LIJ8_9MICC|nr:RNA-binding S4 domain-containing protein [Rothia koreensis]MUN55009.1 RNA-binding S4 domain-containing protein [Rothia koreensis]
MTTSDDQTVEISQDMIRLGQLLKFASLVEDGVEAREVIAEGLVSVNGEPEYQRGKQLHPGDVVTLGDATLRIDRA